MQARPQPLLIDPDQMGFEPLCRQVPRRGSATAWLARSGANPKEVQAVMRHSSITLTMDTYGHLFPGQEAETVARFPAMLDGEPTTLPLRAPMATPRRFPSSQHANQCDTAYHRAMILVGLKKPMTFISSVKTWIFATLCNLMRRHAGTGPGGLEPPTS